MARCVLLALLIAPWFAAPAVPARAAAIATGADAAGAPDANEAVSFDPGMLAGAGADARTVDLSRFERTFDLLEGTYNVDVYLNQEWVGRDNIRLQAPQPGAAPVPCMTTTLLAQLHLLANVATTNRHLLDANHACVPLGTLIPGTHANFHLEDLRMDVQVPQALLGQMPRGWVDPSAWDPGISAFLLNYRINAYRSHSRGMDQTHAYLGMDAGLNLGAWHLRHNGTLSWQSGIAGLPAQRHWTTIDTYARRDLVRLRSTLTVGDSYTDGTIFDTVGLRGIQLATDDHMLPQSRRGYAPVVRGVADSNARVTITQNGIELLQTTVPPGPFTIDDLYPTGYGGDLVVTVTEANGHQHGFRVPYASLAELQRPGVTRYALAAGHLRGLPGAGHPRLLQGTIQHGFTNHVTGYAGFQASNGYAAALIGAAFNTPAGAFAADLTQAGTTVGDRSARSGHSLRLSWNKIIGASDTRLGVAAWRYSTRQFMDLREAVATRTGTWNTLDDATWTQTTDPRFSPPAGADARPSPTRPGLPTGRPEHTVAHADPHRARNRLGITLTQPLGKQGGQLYINASVRDYWGQHATNGTLQLGYNGHVGVVTYGLTAARTREPYGRDDTRLAFNVSMPLGSSRRAPRLDANLTHDTRSDTVEQLAVNSTLGKNQQLSYTATVTHGDRNSGNAASINTTYQGARAVFGASYGTGDGYSQASASMAGAVVVHEHGVTFGQPLGDTIALVHVPGAAGASVQSAPGVTLDGAGYALVPYLTPYQQDTVRIDPQGLPLGIELEATSANIAPYRGAVVRVELATRYGRALLANIQQHDTTPLPFGTQIQTPSGDTVGVVGQGGRALLRVTQPSGELAARLPADADGHTAVCRFTYRIPQTADGKPLPTLDARCQP